METSSDRRNRAAPRAQDDSKLTGMCHVKKSTCSVSLNTHVIRLGHARQRYESPRLGNLGLIIIMGSEVRNATDRVTLNLDVGTQHLSYQRFQTSETNDEEFIIGCQI